MIADVLARWHKLKGEDVFFLTGIDENSQKTVKAAEEKLGKQELTKEEVQTYADGMAENWEETWKKLNINYDGFIRTTEKRHEKIVNEFFMKVYDKGDIYKGEYKGLYCDGCEAFYLEKDLQEGKCPYHKKAPKQISEENYFFKLSKYQDQIIAHIEAYPEFISRHAS
jgi:methionyl-tRNA synthetase